MGYVYHLPEQHVSLRFDYLKGGDEPVAEVTAELDLPGLPGHLGLTRVKLNGSRSKADLIKYLSESAGAVATWREIVEAACTGVLRAMRQGAPIEDGAPWEGSVEPRWLIERLVLANQLNALYGPGSYGKGWLAVACAVAVQSGKPLAGLQATQGNVLYLDWEDDKEEFDKRVTMICRGWGLPFVSIKYRRCIEPLHGQVEFVARHCAEHATALVVIDSFTGAAGTGSEHSSYEESAMRLCAAGRRLGAAILYVDHVTGDGIKNKGLVGRQYGSIMKQNQIRNNMEVKKDQDFGTSWDIGVYDDKGNKGAKRTPLGFHLDFGATPGAVRITRDDVRKSAVLSLATPLRYRLDGLLSRGWVSYPALYEALNDEKQNTVRRALRRGVDDGRYVEDGTRPGWFALMTARNGSAG